MDGAEGLAWKGRTGMRELRMDSLSWLERRDIVLVSAFSFLRSKGFGENIDEFDFLEDITRGRSWW